MSEVHDWLEFRPDHKGRFDEIVARFADGGMVHVETMSSKSVFIGFYRPDIDEVLQFWISADGKLSYHHERSKYGPRQPLPVAEQAPGDLLGRGVTSPAPISSEDR